MDSFDFITDINGITRLSTWIKENLPEEDVINLCPANVTRMLSIFVENDDIRKALDEIRAALATNSVSACNKIVFQLLSSKMCT